MKGLFVRQEEYIYTFNIYIFICTSSFLYVRYTYIFISLCNNDLNYKCFFLTYIYIYILNNVVIRIHSL
jgi:hypothetical protein